MGIKVAELLVEVGADVTRAARDLQQFSGRSSSLLGSLGAAGVAAFAGIGAAAGGMVGIGVKVAGDMEQAKIGFETMLGSAEAADVFLADLKQFAIETPFEMDSLLTGAQRMMAMGIAAKDVRPLLTAVGDAVAAAGGNSEQVERVTTALGQMSAKGKTSAEEMMQLTEAGVRGWDYLAAKLGVTVPEAMDLVSKGAVDAQTTISAVMEGASAQFGGAMEKQSHSLLGMFAAVKDGITTKLGEALGGPVADKLKELFPKVQEQLMSGLDKILPAFADAAVGLISALAPLVDAVAPIVEMIGDVFAEIGPVIGEVIGDLAPHIADLAVLFAELVKALAPLIPAAGRILEAVAPVAVEFAEMAVTLAEALVPVIVKLVDLMAPFIDDIARLAVPLLAAHKGFQLITGAMQTFKASSMAMTMSNPMLLVLGAVAAAALLIIQNWDQVWPVIEKVGQWFGDVFGKIGQVVGDFLGKVVDIGKAIIGGIWDGMRFAFDLLWTWYVEIPIKLIGALWDGLTALYDLGRNVLGWLWNGIVDMWDWLWGNLTDIGGRIVNRITGALGGIFTVGKNLVIGFWNGIVDMWDWLWDHVTDAFGDVIGWVTDLLGISSPSTVFAGIGENLMRGLAQGIEGAAGLPLDALSGVAGGLHADATLAVAARSGSGGAAGAGGLAPQVTIVVQGSIIDKDGLLRAVDDGYGHLGRRSSGLQLAGVL